MPAARAQMLLGVNQTTMASLSMVIIASIIGGTNDIGWEVLSTIRKAQFGESLLVGFVIALIAMVLDRITYGFATKDRAMSGAKAQRALWTYTLIGAAVLAALSLVVPFFAQWPATWVFDPAPQMNAALEYVVINGRVAIETLKNSAFFFLMLPVKIGLGKAVSPFTWGFALTPALIAGYAVIVAAFAAWAYIKGKRTLAALALLAGAFLFVGLTNISWLVLLVSLVCASYFISGRNLAIGTGLGLLFPDRRGHLATNRIVPVSVRLGRFGLLHLWHRHRHLGLREQDSFSHRPPHHRHLANHAAVCDFDPFCHGVQNR